MPERDLFDPKPASEEVWSVAELTRRIRRLLEGEFPRLWVRGEVSNLRRQGSGHVYFSLKDETSQLSCVLFRGDAAKQDFQPENGMDLCLFGELSVYPPRGAHQLIVRLAVRGGEGRLQAEFERLKRKLADEGLFAAEGKRPLPAAPARIAVVTSPTGAALHDFLRILRRRDFRGEIVIFPARVQGTEAGGEIVDRLRRADGGPNAFDLIALIRGGGSLEDLWAFNEEAVARAVAASETPVVSGVGHEIDFTLADLAADHRSETPSGAAETISSLYLEAGQRLVRAREALAQRLQTAVRDRRNAAELLRARHRGVAPGKRVEYLHLKRDDLENRLREAARSRLGHERERIARARHALSRHAPQAPIALGRERLRSLRQRFEAASAARLKERRHALERLRERLEAGSLQKTLDRGFAVLRDVDTGEALTSAQAAAERERIEARLRDGAVRFRRADDA